MKGLAQSPNETVRVGVTVGGSGSSHVNAWSRMKNVEVAAICDVDESHIGEKFKLLETRGAKKPTTYVDLRKMLESKDIDAVSIATPNHWHTLMTIWACQAGKDVYVEKPCSHNVFESQPIIAAARKYNRMVQQGARAGRRRRCAKPCRRCGKEKSARFYMSRGLCYKWRTHRQTPEEPAPAGVDYDLWLGPAPKRAYSKNRFHYNWHGTGTTATAASATRAFNEVDKSPGASASRNPTKVTAIGGKFMFDDDQKRRHDRREL